MQAVDPRHLEGERIDHPNAHAGVILTSPKSIRTRDQYISFEFMVRVWKGRWEFISECIQTCEHFSGGSSINIYLLLGGGVNNGKPRSGAANLGGGVRGHAPPENFCKKGMRNCTFGAVWRQIVHLQQPLQLPYTSTC
jgi:hypothetical protein